MDFFGELNSVQLSLMIASVGLLIVAAIAILWRTLPLRKKASTDAASGTALSDASVIVFAHDDYNALADLLPQILLQDYPGEFEVIVVNDGDSPEVRDVVSGLMNSHRNLYYTSAPDGARNLSRKKLALTLGVKAAKYPVVVNTTSSAQITSDRWLQSIMRHFEPDGAVDVVIGFAAAPPYDDRAFGSRARSFDSTVDALGWVAPALTGHPWRGSEHNLAYRRDLFFRNKGFSRHLNLRDGDDDIFVSEIAAGFNTVVELSDESVVSVPGDNTPRTFKERMARRRFTKRFIPTHPAIAGTVATIAYFLAPLPLAASLFFGELSPFGWCLFIAIGLAWYFTGWLWNPALRTLRGRRLRFSTPLWAWSRPFRVSGRTVRSVFSRSKRYTWE